MMVLCLHHLGHLHEEVNRLGLGGYVSKTGEEGARRTLDHITHGATAENYDPLITAATLVMTRAAEMLGTNRMLADAGCPICVLNTYRTEDGRCLCGNDDCGGREPGSIQPFESWLVGPESAVESVRQFMVEQGWVPADV